MFKPIYKEISQKVYWHWLSANPNAIHLLVNLDYTNMKKQCKSFCEELISYVFHPNRIHKLSEKYDLDYIDYFELLGF